MLGRVTLMPGFNAAFIIHCIIEHYIVLQYVLAVEAVSICIDDDSCGQILLLESFSLEVVMNGWTISYCSLLYSHISCGK